MGHRYGRILGSRITAMGTPSRPSLHAATATAALVMACALSRIDDLFTSEDAAWVAFLTGSELSKMVLAFVAWSFAPERVKAFALSAAVWFFGQAIIEASAKVGAFDGYSAHGPWEYWAFLGLMVTATVLTLRK